MNDIRTIGVIGAGQMGSGIAHVCALSGFDVRLNDISDEALRKGLDAISKGYDRQVARGEIREEQKGPALKALLAAFTRLKGEKDAPKELVDAVLSAGG